MPKTPQEIVRAAYTYMTDIMGPQANKVSNARVEELEQQKTEEDGKKIWSVVIGYDIMGDFPFEKTREYKQFRVDAEGVVLDMKIKKVS